MSRIHDALRRGRAPAGVPNGRRTAHADAVLAALGYKSDKPRAARSALKVLGILLVVLAVAVWFLIPLSELKLWLARPGQTRTVAQANPPNASRIEGRGSRIEKPQSDHQTSTIDPRPPAVSAPQSRIEGRGSMIEKPQNDPRPSTLDPRPPALPATKTPPPVVAGTPRANPPPVSRPRAPGVPDPPVSVTPAPKPAPAPPDEFQLALYYQRSGDFEQALTHYRAALQRDEMNIEAHNNLGHLFLGKGLFDDAAREFQRVVAIDPRYLNAHVNLSAAHLALGRPDAAAAEARAALQIDPRSPDAMVNLSLAQHAAGQAGDAQGSLRRALEIDPHNAAAHYNMARQFEQAGEAAAAIDHYNKFLLYMGPDQAAFAADVRTRLAALAARIK